MKPRESSAQVTKALLEAASRARKMGGTHESHRPLKRPRTRKAVKEQEEKERKDRDEADEDSVAADTELFAALGHGSDTEDNHISSPGDGDVTESQPGAGAGAVSTEEVHQCTQDPVQELDSFFKSNEAWLNHCAATAGVREGLFSRFVKRVRLQLDHIKDMAVIVYIWNRIESFDDGPQEKNSSCRIQEELRILIDATKLFPPHKLCNTVIANELHMTGWRGGKSFVKQLKDHFVKTDLFEFDAGKGKQKTAKDRVNRQTNYLKQYIHLLREQYFSGAHPMWKRFVTDFGVSPAFFKRFAELTFYYDIIMIEPEHPPGELYDEALNKLFENHRIRISHDQTYELSPALINLYRESCDLAPNEESRHPPSFFQSGVSDTTKLMHLWREFSRWSHEVQVLIEPTCASLLHYFLQSLGAIEVDLRYICHIQNIYEEKTSQTYANLGSDAPARNANSNYVHVATQMYRYHKLGNPDIKYFPTIGVILLDVLLQCPLDFSDDMYHYLAYVELQKTDLGELYIKRKMIDENIKDGHIEPFLGKWFSKEILELIHHPSWQSEEVQCPDVGENSCTAILRQLMASHYEHDLITALLISRGVAMCLAACEYKDRPVYCGYMLYMLGIVNVPLGHFSNIVSRIGQLDATRECVEFVYIVNSSARRICSWFDHRITVAEDRVPTHVTLTKEYLKECYSNLIRVFESSSQYFPFLINVALDAAPYDHAVDALHSPGQENDSEEVQVSSHNKFEYIKQWDADQKSEKKIALTVHHGPRLRSLIPQPGDNLEASIEAIMKLKDLQMKELEVVAENKHSGFDEKLLRWFIRVCDDVNLYTLFHLCMNKKRGLEALRDLSSNFPVDSLNFCDMSVLMTPEVIEAFFTDTPSIHRAGIEPIFMHVVRSETFLRTISSFLDELSQELEQPHISNMESIVSCMDDIFDCFDSGDVNDRKLVTHIKEIVNQIFMADKEYIPQKIKWSVKDLIKYHADVRQITLKQANGSVRSMNEKVEYFKARLNTRLGSDEGKNCYVQECSGILPENPQCHRSRLNIFLCGFVYRFPQASTIDRNTHQPLSFEARDRYRFICLRRRKLATRIYFNTALRLDRVEDLFTRLLGPLGLLH